MTGRLHIRDWLTGKQSHATEIWKSHREKIRASVNVMDYSREDNGAEFDIAGYTYQMMNTHAYGMNDRNYCVLAGLILSLNSLPLLMETPRLDETFSTPLRAHFALVIYISIVVISIHSKKAIWLRLLLFTSAILSPLFATTWSLKPYDASFMTVFFVVITPLTGFSIKEWIFLSTVTFTTWIICVITNTLPLWEDGFYEVYHDTGNSYSVDIEHSRQQHLTITFFAFLELIAMHLLSFSTMMFVKSEILTALYILTTQPQLILDLMQGSYTEQESVIPTMMSLHFVSEIKRLLENGTIDLKYFRQPQLKLNTTQDIVHNPLQSKSQSLFSRNSFKPSTEFNTNDNVTLFYGGKDFTRSAQQDTRSVLTHTTGIRRQDSTVADNLSDSSKADRHPFVEEVMTFVKNEIAPPPSFSMGRFINEPIQQSYETWTEHIYIPITWFHFSPYVVFLISACIIDCSKNVVSHIMILGIYYSHYIETETSSGSFDGVYDQDKTPIIDLDGIIVTTKIALGSSIVALVIVTLLGVICLASTCRGRHKKERDHTMWFLFCYLLLSASVSGVHQTLYQKHLNTVVYPEVAISFTQDYLYWLLLTIMAPLMSYTTHREFVVRLLLFLVIKAICLRNLTLNWSILICLLPMMIPYLRNMSGFRRHIFSATISGRIVLNDNIYRGLRWTLNLDQQQQKNDSYVLPIDGDYDAPHRERHSRRKRRDKRDKWVDQQFDD